MHLEHGPNDSVRAVKVIDKRTFSPALDLTRELSIMSFLTKVCLFIFTCLFVVLLDEVFLDLIHNSILCRYSCGSWAGSRTAKSCISLWSTLRKGTYDSILVNRCRRPWENH